MGDLTSRVHEVADLNAFVELCYAEGWTDGLSVLPPTDDLVSAMIDYVGRDANEVIGVLPPGEGIASIEKIAINAVMAGCKPEYMPIVIAAVEAMCTEEFNIHGVLATTFFPGPVIIV